jgi:hypothetical protein
MGPFVVNASKSGAVSLILTFDLPFVSIEGISEPAKTASLMKYFYQARAHSSRDLNSLRPGIDRNPVNRRACNPPGSSGGLNQVLYDAMRRIQAILINRPIVYLRFQMEG